MAYPEHEQTSPQSDYGFHLLHSELLQNNTGAEAGGILFV